MSLPVTDRYSADGAKTRRIGKVSCPEEGDSLRKVWPLHRGVTPANTTWTSCEEHPQYP